MMERKIELLAPAGNETAFNGALNAGADAIYLGIDRFSARKGAGNFTTEELASAVEKAHLRNVKVYVAFNTIVSDEEMLGAVESLVAIYNAGADAVIVQDWGVFRLVREIFPDLPVHASTQMNAHNAETVRFIEEHGAKRVTLAREMSVEEIAGVCSSTDIEVESFIHGALCFSYSGQCLFSSMVGNRSGNRGMCPQACRLGYNLRAAGAKEEVWPTPGKHIMSTRDLCGIRLIPALASAGITALKIEGRMKSPEYVATVVKIYRDALDRYADDPERFSVSEEEISELKEIFSRGFSEGYLSEIRDSRMMSYERASDRGVFVGRVSFMDVYKAQLGIELKQELCTGDEIEVWVSQGGRVRSKADLIAVNGKKVDCAPAGSKAVIEIKEKRHKVHTGDRVFRVHNERLVKKAREIINGTDLKRVPLEMGADIRIGKPITITARVLEGSIEQAPIEAKIKSDFRAEKGERRTLAEDDVIAQLNRLGNTVYKVDSWNISVEPGVMVPLGQLNELRRAVIDKLDAARLDLLSRPEITVTEADSVLHEAMSLKPGTARKKPLIAADIGTVDQGKRAASNGADWIYVRPGLSRFSMPDIEQIMNLRSVYGVKAALATGNIMHDSELEALLGYVEENREAFDALLVDNLGAYHALKESGIPLFLDYHVNVFNRVSAELFREEGVKRICLSAELTIDQIAEIVSSSSCELEVIAHGWLEVMTAEHCVPSASKQSCNVCSQRIFSIEDEKGYRFPVEQDVGCRSHVYNSRELYLLPNTANLINTGVSSFRLLLNRYSAEDAGKATAFYREAIDWVTSGATEIGEVLARAERALPGIRQATTGHYFRALQ